MTKPSNNMAYQPHQKRVIDEYDELYKKTVAIGLFMGTKMFLSLDASEMSRLNKQWQLMQQYGLVLSERIEAFTK